MGAENRPKPSLQVQEKARRTNNIAFRPWILNLESRGCFGLPAAADKLSISFSRCQLHGRAIAGSVSAAWMGVVGRGGRVLLGARVFLLALFLQPAQLFPVV